MDSSSEALRAVVVGLGIMGGHHLRVLQALEDVAVVAVVDPDPERRTRAQRAYPDVEAYGSFAEAADRVVADFACVAVPAASLASSAKDALSAGLHVLVEKPMAQTVAEARGVTDAAARCGRMLSVGLVERFNPAVVALKHKLDEGLAGTIYQVHARRLSPFPDRDSMLGVALDLATHDIDVMRFLLGDEVDRVYAETAQRLHETAEDLLCATLRFGQGATGLLEVNWLTPAKVRQLSVTGERGMFTVDYLTQELRFYEHPVRETTMWGALAGMRGAGEGDMIQYALTRQEPLRQEWQAFIDAVRNGAGPPVTGEDGIAALSIARSIQAANERGAVVRPDYRP
jgi:UDP-N-acetylglucosamine 3-dehydrogenase